MLDQIQTQLEALRERVSKLESRQQPRRGAVGMKGAAEYLNRSREWLRQQHLRGTGPERLPNGMYTFEALDTYLHSQP